MHQNHQIEKACWQIALKNAFTDPMALLQHLQLRPEDIPDLDQSKPSFPLLVPRGFAARMQPGNPNDPLLLQVLSRRIELDTQPGYSKDPVKEQDANPIPGLLHKYKNRVLITLTGACAIHCRYCFRRHFPYQDNTPGGAHWENILRYIQDNPRINEVIFSGGDPLLLKDKPFFEKITSLEKIPHLKRLRLHTRIPVVLPERITTELLKGFKQCRLPLIMALHINHPQEINASIKTTLHAIAKSGVTLLNQTVLLKGVNDHAETLIQLSETLFDAGVMPYYLHRLDQVQGAAHFDIPLEQAQALVWEIMQGLPGYLVPKFVQEMPGVGAKVGVEVRAEI